MQKETKIYSDSKSHDCNRLEAQKKEYKIGSHNETEIVTRRAQWKMANW